MSQTQIEDLTIIIPAAGNGERLGLGPKALLQLDGRTLLSWVSAKAKTLAAEVIVSAPPGLTKEWERHCPGCRVIEGGETHLTSMAALAASANLPLLLNLNVAMPFASADLIRKVTNAARVNGIAGGYLPPDLPVAQINNEMVVAILSRQETAVAQGPNAYQRKLLLAIFAQADEIDWRRQSCLEIAMRYGYTIAAVTGERNNIKLTTIEEWKLAQHYKEFLI